MGRCGGGVRLSTKPLMETPRVALLVETSLGYGRRFLRGVNRYARLHGPWAFYITPADLRQFLPRMEEWGGTGIIARLETPQVEKAVLATGSSSRINHTDSEGPPDTVARADC